MIRLSQSTTESIHSSGCSGWPRNHQKVLEVEKNIQAVNSGATSTSTSKATNITKTNGDSSNTTTIPNNENADNEMHIAGIISYIF